MECEKCKKEMKQVDFIGNMSDGTKIHLRHKEKGLFAEKKTNVVCYVCTSCGKIELRAENPNTFA